MSAALNSKIDNRSSSVSAGVPGPERIAGDESGVPWMQILRGVESVCGSNAADSVASDGMICFGSKAVAAMALEPEQIVPSGATKSAV